MQNELYSGLMTQSASLLGVFPVTSSGISPELFVSSYPWSQALHSRENEHTKNKKVSTPRINSATRKTTMIWKKNEFSFEDVEQLTCLPVK